MDRKQTTELTAKLRGVFPNTNLFNTTAYQESWTKFLQTLSYKRAYKALDNAILQCKYCPNIAEFKEIYDETPDEMAIQEKTDCKICDGNGFKIFTKLLDKRPYEYVAYCDKCSAGMNYKYDGTQMERKSNYYTVPISFYVDTVELEQQEAKPAKNETVEKIRQVAEQKQIQNMEANA